MTLLKTDQCSECGATERLADMRLGDWLGELLCLTCKHQRRSEAAVTRALRVTRAGAIPLNPDYRVPSKLANGKLG